MKNEEITAQLIRERCRWGDTVLLECRQEEKCPRFGTDTTVKATAEEGELILGATYRWYGGWYTHPRYGLQFIAKSFVEVAPHDRQGIMAYLQRAPHVGLVTARVLWDALGGEAVKALRTDPISTRKKIVILGAKRFTEKAAKEAAEWLETQAAAEDAEIDLIGLLAGRGFPRAAKKAALRLWGNKAAEAIRRNPYLLMKIPGCGFGRADAMYIDLGGDPTRLKRQALCVWYAMSRDMSGSTWFDVEFVQEALTKSIGGAAVQAVRACKLGIRGKLLATHRNGEARPYLTEARRSVAEQTVADRAAWFLTRPPAWPEVGDLDVSDHQRAKLVQALMRPLAVFSGGPGTGKTYSAAKLIGKLRLNEVAVVAPTGKAAVRITEALLEHGIELRARTIHSYLKVQGFTEGHGGGFAFEHCTGNPVEEKYIICDESSMIDTQLMADLLSALPDDGHLLLVGDLQQLPPVGHGAPLRDLIAAGAPNGELEEIRRNSGEIVATCAKIRRQEPFELPRQLDLNRGVNLMVHETETGEETAETIVRLIKRIRDNGKHNPVWEAQVVVAVNEKSPVSRKVLNSALQAELNGHNRTGSKFWPGDKVVCLSNSFLPLVDVSGPGGEEEEEGYYRESKGGEREAFVANGELGRVVEEEPKRLFLQFDNPKRHIIVPKGEDGKTSNFDLGYAISCHKSQGSEWPIVVVAVDDYMGARMVTDRSWYYTAISRAKKACILVGKESTLRRACCAQSIERRRTFLTERLHQALKQYNSRREEERGREVGCEEECGTAV